MTCSLSIRLLHHHRYSSRICFFGKKWISLKSVAFAVGCQHLNWRFCSGCGLRLMRLCSRKGFYKSEIDVVDAVCLRVKLILCCCVRSNDFHTNRAAASAALFCSFSTAFSFPVYSAATNNHLHYTLRVAMVVVVRRLHTSLTCTQGRVNGRVNGRNNVIICVPH